SVRDSQLVHAPVDRLARLVERALQIGQVVLLAMMVGDGAGRVVGRGVTDIGEGAFDESQHVLGSVAVEQPPFAAAGDVNGRSVRKEAALPAIVVRYGRVARAAAARRQPGVALHRKLRLQMEPPRAAGLAGRGNDASLLDDL